MTTRILVVGGYGNFGHFISKTLAEEATIQVIIAGRSREKAEALATSLTSANPVEVVALDVHANLSSVLEKVKPEVLIHTSGPFQSQGYHVASVCIEHGVHYIDLADGRDFVAGISALDHAAKERGVLVVSGASSVPGLTSALIDHYRDDFTSIESVDYGITTAQKTTRGLATTAAILGYTGKPFNTLLNGRGHRVFGWQGLRVRHYPKLGRRLLGFCDIPDLALFPERYPDIKNLRFYAGLEIPLVHITLWGLSWLVRWGLIKRLDKFAPLLLRLSFLFDRFGSANSAFHMTLAGIGLDGHPKRLNFELTARDGDGPYIPCMPSILLAKQLALGELNTVGAYPCVGLISLDQYLEALKVLSITWLVED